MMWLQAQVLVRAQVQVRVPGPLPVLESAITG